MSVTHEEIPNVVPVKGVSNLLSLSIFKRAHIPTMPAGSFRTSGDTLPS
ncbi:MAG: hypothetical protein ACR2HX_13125 [Pyrinomonadaceae bacterium]